MLPRLDRDKKERKEKPILMLTARGEERGGGADVFLYNHEGKGCSLASGEKGAQRQKEKRKKIDSRNGEKGEGLFSFLLGI